MAAYDFKIQYVSSKCNGNADALCRLPLAHSSIVGESQCGASTTSSLEHHYLWYIDESLPIGYKDIAIATQKDKILCRIYSYIMFGWPYECEEYEKPYFYRKSDLNIEHGCIFSIGWWFLVF